MRYTPPIDFDDAPRFAPLAIMRRIADRVRWPVMAIVILYAYLAFHAFSGSQGLVNWMNNDSRADRLTLQLEKLQVQRANLEAQVEALDAAHLDLDALDILSREKLFYSHPKELTIWLDPQG